jgi:Mn2+/Fe2+ NRAMP family transporter
VANGLVAPLILILIVAISSSKKIMGKRVNGVKTALAGWTVAGLMIVVGGATIASFVL